MRYLRNASLINNVTLAVILFLTFFAEAENFSIYKYNLIPVRIFVPFLSIFLIVYNRHKINFINKSFIIFNFIFLYFLGILTYSLLYTLDINTGMGLVFFWTNIYLFGIALFIISTDVILYPVFKYYYFIFTILIIFGSVYRYLSYLLKIRSVYFPGFFIQDGNHLAFYIIFVFLINFYFYTFFKNLVIKITYLSLIFLLGLVFAGCDASGASILFGLILFLLYIYLIVCKSKDKIIKLSLFILIFILAQITWSYFPKNLIIQSPFFNDSKIEVIDSVILENKKPDQTKSESPKVSNETKESIKTNINNKTEFFNPIRVISFYKMFPFFPASIFAHVTLIYSGIVLFLNKPILGWGLGSFNEAMQLTGLHDFFVLFDPSAAGVANYPAHNMYTNYLSESGILGFIGYISILFYCFYLLTTKFKNSKEFKYKFKYFIFILCYLSYFAFSMMYNLHEEFVFFALLIMAIAPIHSTKDTDLLEPYMLKLTKKWVNKIPIIQNYLIIFIIMTSYILERRLIPINANLNYVRYSIVLFVLVSFVKKLVDRKRFKTDIIFYTLVSISIFKSISILFAYNKFDSIVSSIYWIGLAFLYLTFFNYDLSKKRKDWVGLVIVAGAVNAFFSYLQIVFFYFFNLKILNFYGWVHPFGFRVTGLSYDANHLAAFILLPIFICSYFVIEAKKIKDKIISALLLFYFFPIFYFSSSRSALIGIVFTLIVYILFFILKPKYFNLFSRIYFFLIPTFFISIYLLFYPTLALKNNQQELGAINTFIFNITKNVVIHGRGLDGSAFAHFSLVYSSFKLQSQHNFLGTGAGNFAEGLYKDKELSNLFRSLDASAFDGGNFPAHSMYGEALGEGGFIGFVLFISILFLILNKYLKVIEKDRNLFPFFIYFYSICFFMLFYNINEEFFWVFTFLGLFLIGKTTKN